MDTTVIECRNKTAKVTAPLQANGDWTTNLNESISIYKGDQIACRNVFVDTKALQAGPNTKIQIPTNTTLEFDYMLYNVNWEGAVATNPDNDTFPDSAILPINAQAGTYEPKNDGKLYVACEEKNIPPLTAVMRSLYMIQFKGVFFAQTGGEFNVSVLFADDTNTTKHEKIYLPKVDWDDVQEANASIEFNENGNPTTPTGPLGSPLGVYVALPDGSPDFKIPLATYTKGGFTYNGGKFYKDTSVYPLNTYVGPALPTKQYSPKIFKTTITLEGGPNVSYDPVDLCQTINRELTKINPDTVSATQLNGDNLFLQHVGKDQPAGNEHFNYFIPVVDRTTNGGNKFGFQYNYAPSGGTGGARWVGASQVELSYDPNLNKFQFDFLHTPLLDSGSLSVAMIRREQHPSATFDTIPINKNGGILLHNLLAFDDEGNGIPFWSETLGFGKTDTTQGRGSLNYMLNNFAPSPKGADGIEFQINGTPVSIPVFLTPVKDGVNITGGFQGIDSVLQKQSTDFNIPPTLPTSSGAEVIFSTSDKQVSIEAATTTFNSRSEIDFGYFLVEVQTKFTTRMLTEIQSHRNRVAIVSRYYQQDSYTSAAEDSAIVYTHNSEEPLLINSFKCRILDSDGNLATVGVDNTLFLQVLRALPLPQQLPLPAPQDKEKESLK